MDLQHIQAIDQHAHNLLRPEIVESGSFASSFTESADRMVISRHAPHSFFYRRSLRDIADLLECEPTEDAILSRRREIGFEELCQRCFKASNLSAAFLDDGFLPEKTLPVEWHERFLPVKRILRLESLAETLIRNAERFEDFIGELMSRIDPPPAQVVALKSIAAYRTGLRIDLTPIEKARSSFDELKKQCGDMPFRLMDKVLIDGLITLALDVCAKHGLPLQFHTGFGDPDLDLRLATPLHLRPLLEEKGWRRAHVILLHAGYPYAREAGYLASVYPQVHLDFGLAIPFLSVSGMRSILLELLELTPVTKLMFSSDAHAIPELYYLGAKWARRLLAEALEGAVKDSDLTAKEADWVAARILAENAGALYFGGGHPRA
jgi:predicted TIM-barrel fold metal-dependent hydrolase